MALEKHQYLHRGWPAATVVTPLWSFKVEEQSYVSFPLQVWVRARKTLMILLASVAGALLFVNHSPAGQRPRILSDAQPDGLADAGIIAITMRKYPHWPNCAGPLGLTRRHVCLVLVGLFHGNTWAELEPARIRIDCCRSGIMRTVGYLEVDLAFTARDGDPWQSGTAAALPVAGSGMDRDHLRGILLIAHSRSRPEHYRPVAGGLAGNPAARLFRGSGFQGPVQDAASEALVTRAGAISLSDRG